MLEKSYNGYRQSEIDIHRDVVGNYAKRGYINDKTGGEDANRGQQNGKLIILH